jgi:aminoglycoside phosphotransferase (APT) family kinase protein
MVALAGIHRPFLDGQALAGQNWLIPPLQAENVYWEQTIGAAYLQTWLDQPRALTYPGSIHEAGRLSRCLAHMAAMLVRAPAGLIHGDAHIANAYRLPDGRAGFYDWQCVGRGPPIFDVAYFVISALDTAVRRDAERDLIRTYLDALKGAASVPSFDEAWLGYRRYALYGLWAWLTNPTEFHPEPVNVIVSNRFAHAVADLDTLGAVEAWT